MATLGVDFSDVQQAFLKVLPRKSAYVGFRMRLRQRFEVFSGTRISGDSCGRIGENVSIGFRSDRAACSADAVS